MHARTGKSSATSLARWATARRFPFHSAEEIWNEIRSVWKAGAGISYARLEHGGLQWPCPDESHPGTAILHADSFAGSKTAPLQCIDFQRSAEARDADYPFLLTTGRTLYQFNAGTMTMRTPNRELRATDTLDISPADAARLGISDGEIVRVTSRHGAAELPLHIDPRVKDGELFATFHASGNRREPPHRARPRPAGDDAGIQGRRRARRQTGRKIGHG